MLKNLNYNQLLKAPYASSHENLWALLTVVGMFLSDLALAALDPRIRLGESASK